jgi:hypothetical protein
MIYEKNKKGTENINFLRITQDCDSIEKITTVSNNDIKKEPSISWYHSDYLNDNLISELSKKMDYEAKSLIELKIIADKRNLYVKHGIRKNEIIKLL